MPELHLFRRNPNLSCHRSVLLVLFKEQLYYTTRFIYSYIFCSKLYSAKFINLIIILICKNTDTSISINSLLNRYIYIGKHIFNIFLYLQMILFDITCHNSYLLLKYLHHQTLSYPPYCIHSRFYSKT